MKSLTIMVPFINNLQLAMPMLGCLKYNTSPDVEFMIIDNGSTEPIEKYVTNYIRPAKMYFQRFEENQGLNLTNQWAYEHCESDLLMLLHNDVFIYEKDWDVRMRKYFDEIDKLGVAGFFGAQGCLPNGGRLQDVEFRGQQSGMSNMLEAEIHGMRLKQPWRSASIFDSFAMMLSMDMLRANNGFDQRYPFHHFYDRDISLESLRHGFNNIVVNVPCHHIGGLTNANPLFQEWLQTKIGNKMEDGRIHNQNMQYFIDKWNSVLPIYVNNDFSFRSGPIEAIPGLEYKGDAIRHFPTT